MTNLDLAQLLRKMAAAYQMLGENRFKIIAYTRAAESIEQLTRDAKDYWDNGKLGDIPGVGEGISYYLDELFRTGQVRHFEEVMMRIPEAVFPLLLIPGIGPKKAYRLVKEFDFKSAKTVVADLEKVAKEGKIASLEGFGDKSEDVILSSIALFKKGAIKENRMELPNADRIAQEVITHLKKLKEIESIDVLGSLRRQVATIGDIDMAVSTKKPASVIAHFLTYPHEKVIDEGPQGATILLHSGRQVDLRVQDPSKYGAMLQYFTGSKHHNIKLREHALSKGMSLNEYGITLLRRMSNNQFPISNYDKSKKLFTFSNEKSFYNAIGLPWIPPELREDKGEIEAALQGTLPKLVEIADIRGDLHIHTNYDLSSSHDLGADPLTAYLDRAGSLGYGYIGISDHNPSVTKHTVNEIVEIMKRRKEYYEHQYSSWVKNVSKSNTIGRIPHLFIMCEVDIQPDGSLALPEEAFDSVDGVVVSIHSSFTQGRAMTTKRVVAALTAHPKVRIFGHPTGRLLTKREGVELDWREVSAACRDRDIALEVNAAPERLDLPDTIVYDARKAGIKFCIDTDSHAVTQMDMMRYGVSVARRGWCRKDDIVNAMEYTNFKRWLMRS